jgi:hypothetical protein
MKYQESLWSSRIFTKHHSGGGMYSTKIGYEKTIEMILGAPVRHTILIAELSLTHVRYLVLNVRNVDTREDAQMYCFFILSNILRTYARCKLIGT